MLWACDYMQAYNMDSQYESVNVPDFDVVRSTQFDQDFARGVSDLCSLVFSWSLAVHALWSGV